MSIHTSPLVVALLSLLAPAATASVSPADGVTIPAITYSGTGCPAGSATAVLSPDGREFVVLFSAYAASVGPGVAPSEARKDCLLRIDMSVPTDYTYSISNVDYSGYAQLDPGIVGGRASTYHLTGEPSEPVLKDQLAGPMDSDYLFVDEPTTLGPLESPCGKGHHLNIRTAVRLNGAKDPTGFGLLTSDETDATTESWHLVWTPCAG
jgi:hypothetical protein